MTYEQQAIEFLTVFYNVSEEFLLKYYKDEIEAYINILKIEEEQRMSGISGVDIEHMSDLDAYQEEAFNYALPSAKGLMYMIPGLAAEAGEVAGVYAKFLRDANRDLYPIKNDLMKELGGCLWFVASIAKLYDVKLSDIARMNIDKLEGRKQRNTIGGSGNDR